ncbi:MAG: sigma-54-dependent Fis family transcriptional regulator [Candidatus Eisenbacteria bacterium]|uniref:Sigma-54-dependent Fis family transcriptional regulator n=1 Tax=Eiseniibacteriota bacterium TaxID=2212470 RepID=A0A956SBV0_UNCEI|nr:sigma-54-dependent Fis family transcriptional regulator [Candidatus Eisenbacteria bacterium]MCB9464677.1 sigma-54-dependent Fis family transcriptional regulator [Candidatus Eisenbacteria bacterium]
MKKTAGTVLIVEDDDAMRMLLDEQLTEAGYRVFTAVEGAEGLEQVLRHSVDVVVTDLKMPGMKGDELLEAIRSRDPELPVVVITAFGSIESAVETMKAGAYHYVAKPFRMNQLLVTVGNALRERRLRQELQDLKSIMGKGRWGIVAESVSMRRVLDLVSRAAASDSPILIQGESGTGKELIARAFHAESPRANGPFVALNCSAIPEALLESQLFGHRKGAFTDAREDHRGLFQEAEGGTLFLDEIGDMALPLQAKLLRALQEREVRPIGASATIRVNVRILAATHQDLDQWVKEGRFRSDLFYRLNVITVKIPPLRDRPEDLVPLIAHFLDKHGRRLDRPGWTVASDTLELFKHHSWPGNVRELENVIERGLILGRDQRITPDDLPESVHDRAPLRADAGHSSRPIAEVEKEHIVRTLRAVRGNKAAAARILGFDRKTLYRKLEQYRIEDESH